MWYWIQDQFPFEHNVFSVDLSEAYNKTVLRKKFVLCCWFFCVNHVRDLSLGPSEYVLSL